MAGFVTELARLAALRAVAPRLAAPALATWSGALARPMRACGIMTPRRVAAFLGQCAVESCGFTQLVENLDYQAARLCQVWPSRFPTQEAAAACAHNPEKLANRIYANRMGNGDEASGDGFRFRGHGLIQLTGRRNHERLARDMGQAADAVAAWLTTPAGAAGGACWFWNANALNRFADAWDIEGLTRAINGGLHACEARRTLCEAALQAIHLAGDG